MLVGKGVGVEDLILLGISPHEKHVRLRIFLLVMLVDKNSKR